MGKIYVERESSYGDVSATMSQSLVIKRFPTQLSVSVRYSMKKEFGKFKIEVQFFVVFCDKKNAARLFGTAKVVKSPKRNAERETTDND